MSNRSRLCGDALSRTAARVEHARLGADNGRIQGQVLDSQGAESPGRDRDRSTSPALQGAKRRCRMRRAGSASPAVPPGVFSKADSPTSRRSSRQHRSRSRPDGDGAITMQLASVAETLTVTAASPIIDSTSTVTGVVADSEMLNRLPVRRDIYVATRFAAGVVDDAVGPTGARVERRRKPVHRRRAQHDGRRARQIRARTSTWTSSTRWRPRRAGCRPSTGAAPAAS